MTDGRVGNKRHSHLLRLTDAIPHLTHYSALLILSADRRHSESMVPDLCYQHSVDARCYLEWQLYSDVGIVECVVSACSIFRLN